MVSTAGLEPAWTDLEDRRNSVLPRRDGQRGESRTRILNLRRVALILLSFALKMVEMARIALASAGCKPAVLLLNDIPMHGPHSRSRTAFGEVAALSLAVWLSVEKWSGIRESNPSLDVGNVASNL